jgi:hypothetical protein
MRAARRLIDLRGVVRLEPEAPGGPRDRASWS